MVWIVAATSISSYNPSTNSSYYPSPKSTCNPSNKSSNRKASLLWQLFPVWYTHTEHEEIPVNCD